MTLEELAAHGPAELAGQKCRRRGVAAGEQATDIVERAEGEVGHGGEVAAVARPLGAPARE
eukprot:1268565-Pleurochrysis_carterae.AAC.1